MDETLIAFGAAVKALGDGKVGGYLVRYSDADQPDIQGEFFTKATDFGADEWPVSLPIYYRHGFDRTIGKRRLGRATVKSDEEGLWIEGQLNLRDRYEQAVYKLAQMGKLGWSSGSASHLVEKETAGKAAFLRQWPIVEASLTPDPAEPRGTGVLPLKSLQSECPDLQDLFPASEGPGFDVKAILAPGLDFDEKGERAASVALAFSELAHDKAGARVKEGRVLSAQSRQVIEEVAALYIGQGERLRKLLADTAPKPKEAPAAAAEPAPEAASAETASLHTEFLRRQARLRERVMGA